MNISSHVPLIYAIFSHKEGSMGSNLFETFHSSPFKTPAKKQPLLFEEEQPLKKTCKNSWFMNGLDPPSFKKNRHTNPVSFFKKNDRFAMVYAPSRSNLSSNIPIQI